MSGDLLVQLSLVSVSPVFHYSSSSAEVATPTKVVS